MAAVRTENEKPVRAENDAVRFFCPILQGVGLLLALSIRVVVMIHSVLLMVGYSLTILPRKHYFKIFQKIQLLRRSNLNVFRSSRVEHLKHSFMAFFIHRYIVWILISQWQTV